jgi:hypothetical protein
MSVVVDALRVEIFAPNTRHGGFAAARRRPPSI